MKTIWTTLGLLLVTTAAVAQEAGAPASTSVTVPWGSWVISAMSVAQPIVTFVLTSAVSWLVAAYVPPWMRAFAGQAAQVRVNALLIKAVQSALAQTAGAVTGQALTIPVASTVLARAAQYAIDQAPDLVKSVTYGRLDNLLKMLLARMEELGVSPPDFDIKNTNAIVQGVVKGQDGKFDFSGAITAGMGGH